MPVRRRGPGRKRNYRPLTIREILDLVNGPPWSEFDSDKTARRAYDTHPEELAEVREDTPLTFYFDEERRK